MIYNLAYLTEMRAFNAFIQCFCLETVRMFQRVVNQRMKICYRCKNDDPSINAICLNCKRAIYCSKKCMKKNRILHEHFCKFYLEKSQTLRIMINQIIENQNSYEQHSYRLKEMRHKDKSVI